MTKSLAGQLLVASTALDDGLFARSVCLVVHHDEEGAIGLLLNRPLHPQPAQLLKMLGSEGDDRLRQQAPQSTVHFGGPLSGPVVALHASPTLAEAETSQGVYVAAQKDHLEQLLKQAQAPLRIIVGHAGWKPGQLEAEVAVGQWHFMPASSDIVFCNDESMWNDVIREACGRSVTRWVGARPTANPELN